jgi:hypothetical protein
MSRVRIALLALWCAAPLAAAPPHDAASARTAVLARFDAAIHNDVSALDKLLADDLDYCTFRGECETKAKYLGDIQSGRVHYVSGEPSISKVKLFADSATVIGLATVTVARDGAQQTIHISWAAVLAWREARWQMTTWTSTLLAEPSR